jgi:DNA modification methylase
MSKTLPSLEAFKTESLIDEEDEVLWPIILDVTRVADKKITEQIAAFKSNSKVLLTAHQKQSVRQYLLGLSGWPLDQIEPIPRDILDFTDYSKALELIFIGMERNRTMLLGTLRSRISQPQRSEHSSDEYLKIIAAKEQNLSQFVLIDTGNNAADESAPISRLVVDAYSRMANYHFLAVIFRGQSWKTVSEVALHAESFLAERNFRLFERTKDKKAEELIQFLKLNPNINFSEDLTLDVKWFFESVGYGLNFQDLILSESDETRILIFQKVELDDSVIPCPDCLKTMVRGNSYPKMLLKSYECHNPDCSSRSKIGRGKRFDLFNVKRNLKLRSATESDQIDASLRKKFRRDIIEDSKDVAASLISFFTWTGDKVLAYHMSKGAEAIHVTGRVIEMETSPAIELELQQPRLATLISKIMPHVQIEKSQPSRVVHESLFSLYQGDSTSILNSIPEKISHAVTSPPYYNAREYSQWPTLICYLVDMAISAQAVFEKLNKDGVYFYNIGDIVGQDNLYVSSHMSNRRLMLGFYSIMIFEIVGFQLLGNVVWDKGEVQSKRNSTDNPYPTYIKPINCYEHIFIFGKAGSQVSESVGILRLDPVRKINSKGENLLGHTAPYPEEIVNYSLSLVKNRVDYVLDPFVGSGTTVIASSKLGFKSVGVERDSVYFGLALERINANPFNLRLGPF